MNTVILEPSQVSKYILEELSHQEPIRSSFRKCVLGTKIRQRTRSGQEAQESTLLGSSFIDLKYQLRDVTPFLFRQNVLSTLQDVAD